MGQLPWDCWRSSKDAEYLGGDQLFKATASGTQQQTLERRVGNWRWSLVRDSWKQIPWTQLPGREGVISIAIKKLLQLEACEGRCGHFAVGSRQEPRRCQA